MTKKIIQIPIEDELLRDLDKLSEDRGLSRSALIREACRAYLRLIAEDVIDRAYVEAYRRLPEKPDLGEFQVQMLSTVLEKEDW